MKWRSIPIFGDAALVAFKALAPEMFRGGMRPHTPIERGARVKNTRYDGAALRDIRAGTHPHHSQARECARRKARDCIQ